MNLDYNAQLVQCDSCDRWEHMVCHRKADAAAGRPKRDFANEDFLCEDCEEIGTSVKILPAAPRRERSEKQLAGAMKGAAKRKARAERIKRDTDKSNFDYDDSPPAKKPAKRRKAPKSRKANRKADETVDDDAIDDSVYANEEDISIPNNDDIPLLDPSPETDQANTLPVNGSNGHSETANASDTRLDVLASA